MRLTAFTDYAPRSLMRLADDPSRVFTMAYPSGPAPRLEE